MKSALDESFPAVLGKIELQIPQLQHATWKVRQHLAEAITSGFFRKGSCALTYSLYVAATRDAMVLELCNNGEDTLQLKCVLLPPGKQEIYVNPPDERAFPDVIEVGQQLGCSTLMPGISRRGGYSHRGSGCNEYCGETGQRILFISC